MSSKLPVIADALLRMQKRIGEIIKSYNTVSLIDTRLAVRYQIEVCNRMLIQLDDISAIDDVSTALCQQYTAIIHNNLKLLKDLERNCIKNQVNIEMADKLEMLYTMQNAVKKLKGEIT